MQVMRGAAKLRLLLIGIVVATVALPAAANATRVPASPVAANAGRVPASPGAEHAVQSGALTRKAGLEGCHHNTGGAGICELSAGLSNPVAVTVSPDGENVYVAASGIPSGSSGYLVVLDRTPSFAGVSGTVTTQGSGAPIGGSWVAALRTTDYSLAGAGVADGSGNYVLNAPAGNYLLYLVDPTGAHTSGFHGAPTTVTVLPGERTNVNPAMTPTRGTIAGTVRASVTSAPIGGALAFALNASTGAIQRGVVANASGQFSLPGLRPANHWVGYIDPTGAHATRFHPAATDVGSASALPVTAGSTTTADGALPAQTPVAGGSSVGGTVTRTGGGPLAGAFVIALRAADLQLARAAVANGSGQYSLNLAAPGPYKIAVIDSTGLHTMEWFDNQPPSGLGSATSVNAPATVNVALDPATGSVSGTVVDDPSNQPLPNAWVIAIGPTGIEGGAVTAANGTYTITGLPPGTYRVTFADPVGGRPQEYFDGAPDFIGATPLNLTAGGTLALNAALG